VIENFKLHVFRVVADSLNFSKAAGELHLSQPAVTSQVRSLEEVLGIALFDRVGRNAALICTTCRLRVVAHSQMRIVCRSLL
jgi:DNA-binding transcriptional LysR family regulator